MNPTISNARWYEAGSMRNAQWDCQRQSKADVNTPATMLSPCGNSCNSQVQPNSQLSPIPSSPPPVISPTSPLRVSPVVSTSTRIGYFPNPEDQAKYGYEIAAPDDKSMPAPLRGKLVVPCNHSPPNAMTVEVSLKKCLASPPILPIRRRSSAICSRKTLMSLGIQHQMKGHLEHPSLSPKKKKNKSKDKSKKNKTSNRNRKSKSPQRGVLKKNGSSFSSSDGNCSSCREEVPKIPKPAVLKRANTVACMEDNEIETQPLSRRSSTIVRRRSTITFDKRVKVKKVVSTSELAELPEEELWFQQDEIEQMRKKSIELAVEAEQNQYCVRGLEKFMPSNRQAVIAQKYEAWDTVLDEQDIQRRRGTLDEDKMAKAYRVNTRKCQRAARRRAKEDAKAIENYLKSTRKVVRALSSEMLLPEDSCNN